MIIHLADQNGNTSEHSLESINENLSKGLIDPNCLAWTAGLGDWVHLKTIDGVVCPKPPPLSKTPKKNILKPSDIVERELYLKKEHYELPKDWVIKKTVAQPNIFEQNSDYVLLKGVQQAWPRLLARFFDYYTGALLCLLLLGIVLSIYDFTGLGFAGLIFEYVLSAVLFVILMIYYEAFLLSKKGTTPGKFIAGIKVLNASGGFLDFRAALRRSHAVIRSGCWYFIGWPIFTLFSFESHKKELAQAKNLSWDSLVGATIICKSVSLLRKTFLVLGILVLGFFHLGLNAIGKKAMRQEIKESISTK
jgi:uncharacterized RDD family membrane protein YckC